MGHLVGSRVATRLLARHPIAPTLSRAYLRLRSAITTPNSPDGTSSSSQSGSRRSRSNSSSITQLGRSVAMATRVLVADGQSRRGNDDRPQAARLIVVGDEVLIHPREAIAGRQPP